MHLAQELLMNVQHSGGSRSFTKETSTLKIRSTVSGHQKLTMTNWEDHWSWSFYTYRRSCPRTSSILCLFRIWSKLERWESSISGCLMNWPNFFLKKLSLWSVAAAAAAAAKSLQLCPTLCDPTDGSPPGSPVSGILQERTLEWVAISFSSAWKWKVKVKSLSRVQLLATPWTAAFQAPPFMGFSRQEYWSGVPLPSLFEELSSLILYNDNKPFLDWWILYDNQRWPAQWLDQEEAPKHFPKPNLH